MYRLLSACAIGWLLVGPASAAPLTITKTVTTVADPLGNAFPRAVPGSVAEYKTLATNPLANSLKPVTSIVVTEPIPANASLSVADLAGTGKGPVEFLDGSVLVAGLLSSNLTYTFTSLAAAGDSIEFFDGTSWSYTPVADASGYDSKVRAIRITLSGTFATSTSFQLRFRVKVN